MKPKFCAYCGTPLRENDRFCGQCGQAVPTTSPATASESEARPSPAAQTSEAAQVPDPRPSQAPSEAIVGILPGVQRRQGFLGLKVDSYNMVITPQRLVFAYISKETQNSAIRQANAEAKNQGKGLLGVVAAQMRWLDVVCRQYEDKSVDAILQQFPGSFQINNADVRRIRFLERGDRDSGRVEEIMQIDSSSGRLKLFLMGTNKNDAVRQFRQILPSALK